MKDCRKCNHIMIQRILGKVRDLCARDALRSRHPSCHDERKDLSPARCGPDAKFWQSEGDQEC